MNPPVNDSIAPRRMSLIKGKRNNPTRTAPIGSLIPDKKDQRIGFNLLSSYDETVVATAIPSGILCKAIAVVINIPRLIPFRAPIKVAYLQEYCG
ncbi:hypothetical protein LCGC14_1983340 [marine sediment metagenome]|uniref:Uncharacterized protein n=1 Tax=marine sediment metagenome TaxID=412755 RepID=A0A0F9HLG6_9ZZZZ